MKKILSVAVAAILFAGAAAAQNVNIGIKGGVNIANINNDDGTKYNARTGFNLGLLGHIHLAPQLALQPEVVYSAQGVKYTTAGLETKLKLDYINVPVLLQYMFDNGFRLQAGPQVGFLINAKNEINSNSINVKDSYKKVDFGISGGIGYVNTPTGLGVDARYNLGLSKINEAGSNKLTNRVFQIGLFYLFNHK